MGTDKKNGDHYYETEKQVHRITETIQTCVGVLIYSYLYAVVFVSGEACNYELLCDPDQI